MTYKVEGQIDFQVCRNNLREAVDYLRGCSEALLQADRVLESDSRELETILFSMSDLLHVKNNTSFIDAAISQLLEVLDNHIDDFRTGQLLDFLQGACELSGQLKELLSMYEAKIHFSTLFDDLYNRVLGEIDQELNECLSLSGKLKSMRFPVITDTRLFLEKLKTHTFLTGNPPAFDATTEKIYQCFNEVLERYTPISVSISLAEEAIQRFRSQTSAQHQQCFEKIGLRLSEVQKNHSQLSERMNILHHGLIQDNWQAVLDQLVKRARQVLDSGQQINLDHVALLLKQVPEDNCLKNEARQLYVSIQEFKFSSKCRFPFDDVINTTPLPLSRLKRASSFANALKPVIELDCSEVSETGLSDDFKLLNLDGSEKRVQVLSSPVKLNNSWSTSSVPVSRLSPLKMSPSKIPTLKPPLARNITSRIPQIFKTPSRTLMSSSSSNGIDSSSPIHLDSFRASLGTFPRRECRRKSMIPVPNAGHSHSPKFPSAFSTPNLSSRKFANSLSDEYF